MHTLATPATLSTPASSGQASAGRAPGFSRGALYAAAAAAALALLLLALGAGLGLTPLSPWSRGAAPVGVGAILWIVFMQLAVCALGGYLAGRWRAKWVGPDNEQLHARDRANALPAWMLASLVTVVLLTGAGRALLGGAFEAGAAAAVAAAPQPGVHAMLWMLVALVLGAIAANLAATFGGLQRDGLLLQLREH